jgi:hypothetical protein
MHPNFRVTSKVTVDLKNIDKSDCHFEKQKTTEPMDYRFQSDCHFEKGKVTS